MDLIFHAQDTTYKSPFGAVSAGTPIRFQADLPKDGTLVQPQLLVCRDGQWDQPQIIPMTLQQTLPQVNRFRAAYTPKQPALLFYRFSCTHEGKTVDFYSDPDGKAVLQGDCWWQLTVYDPAYQTPDFIKGGLYYQIFPDRFFCSKKAKQNVPADRILHPDFSGLPEFLPNAQGKILNNDYFGGDLAGITEKIPYLRELGVTCLYLNPIFEAHSNHRYNTADYRKIDPLLGTEEDFRQMCDGKDDTETAALFGIRKALTENGVSLSSIPTAITAGGESTRCPMSTKRNQLIWISSAQMTGCWLSGWALARMGFGWMLQTSCPTAFWTQYAAN